MNPRGPRAYDVVKIYSVRLSSGRLWRTGLGDLVPRYETSDFEEVGVVVRLEIVKGMF